MEERIRERVEELEQLYERIISCRVTVDMPHRQHQKGNLFSVRIELLVPEREIAVGHEHRNDPAHEDVYVAIRDAFDAAERQLEAYAQQLRGEVKVHAVPDHGKVARIFPADGFGFVETIDGTEIYFHENSVAKNGFANLEVGQEVRIVIAEGEGEKGPQASTVVPIARRRLEGDVRF